MREAPTESGPSGPFAFLSRRRFLKLGLGAGVALGGAGASLVALRGGAPNVDGLRILSAHEYRTLAALARTQIPAGGPFALGADELDLARLFDGFLADEPPHNIADLRRAIVLIEYGPIIFHGRVQTFSNLDAETQLEHWAAWSTSRLLLRRQVAAAFRRFFSFVFYGRADVARQLGYVYPEVVRAPAETVTP